MGWAFCGKDDLDRDIGYGVQAECDGEACNKKIDRGLGYICGIMHGGDKGCGRYFCEDCRWSHPCKERDDYMTELESEGDPSNAGTTG